MDHRALNEEFETDIDKYAAGQQRSFPITDELAASVARWPVVTEEELTSFLEHVNEAQPEENSHETENSD
jgi:hypothetical protein